MIKPLLYSALLIFTFVATAQNSFETELDSIQDETQATKFIETHTSNKGQIFVFNKEKHKSELAKDLFKLGEGGNKVVATEIEKIHYKIIDKYDVPYYRVSYIYFDGSKKTKDEILELQQLVLSKYQKGFRFKDLAKQYSMDGNATRGGDLGWFAKGEMASEFENEIINSANSVGDIFTVSIPERNWYYVVLKTHSQKMIEEIKVLKVTEKI